MRILLLSDIHANLEALEACLEAAPEHDYVFNLGDIVGYGASPNEVTAISRGLGNIFVRGNHDKACTGVSGLEDFNATAATAALWTMHNLEAPHLQWLRKLPAGPILITELPLQDANGDGPEATPNPSATTPRERSEEARKAQDRRKEKSTGAGAKETREAEKQESAERLLAQRLLEDRRLEHRRTADRGVSERRPNDSARNARPPGTGAIPGAASGASGHRLTMPLECVHGSPIDEDEYLLDLKDAVGSLVHQQAKVTFFGHSHVQGAFSGNGVEWISLRPDYKSQDTADSFVMGVRKDYRYLINPGSVGQPRDHDWRAAFAIYDTENHHVKYFRVPYDIKKAQKKILEAHLPERLAQRLQIGR